MRCIFIYNPKSGRGKVFNNLKYIKNKLQKIYNDVTLYESLSTTNLKEAVIKASEEYDVIIFSGGDGTFNDVANALATCERRPPLGYIPLGTTNDIARNLGIPCNVRRALKIISEGYTIKHDVGKINDQYFIYVAAIGACTATSYTTNHAAKKVLGRLAYAKDGINQFFTAPVNKVKITDENTTYEQETPLLLILNSISVAGIPINPLGHLNDGTFDIMIVKSSKAGGRLNILGLFIAGVLGIKRRRNVVLKKSSHFTIEVSEKATWCIDGERGPQGTVTIQNIHSHLTLIVARKKAKKRK